MSEFNEKSYSSKMDKSIQSFKKDISTLRTGRANISMLDTIKVDVYGQQMPINQKLAYKGLKYLSILLILLILSPLLFTISIKALKLYDEGALFYISMASLIVCIIMAFCTLFFCI